MNWYIGQRIIVIRNHSQGFFKKGDEFIIKGLSESICNCKGLLIDIGIRVNTRQVGRIVRCRYCRGTYIKSNVAWFSEINFQPFDFDISELTNILKEPILEAIYKWRKYLKFKD